MVKANHFLVEILDKDLHQYDVSITPGVTSPGVNRAVMKQLVTLYKESHLGGRLPAYDGRKSLYTAGSLPFSSTEFTVTLVDEEDVAREFKVVIKFAARANLHHLGMFLQGRQADAPQEAVRVLNIILCGLPMSHPGCVRVGRSLYSPDLGRKQPLGEGLESRHGFYQSIRPTKTDMSSTTFIEPLPVIDFVSQLLNKDLSVAKPLSHADRDKIKKALIGVKVEITHRRDTQRKYRITNLVSQVADEVIFSVDERGTIKSMVEYFEETYGYVIQYTQLPCLQVGNNQRPTCLPMEVCKIVEGQRYSKRLDERQITSLLELMCIQPRDREDDIRRTACLHLYAKISENSSRVEARVLPPPRRMVNGGKVKEWICINFSSGIEDAAVQIFCEELARTCTTFGMKFNPEPVLPVLSGRPDRVELVLKAMYHDAMIKLQPHKKELDLLIVILPNKCSLYGNVKRICETDLGIISQCCRRKNVRKRNKVYLESVSLKIKMKVGGRNTVLVDVLSRL